MRLSLEYVELMEWRSSSRSDCWESILNRSTMRSG